ncbi:MAG TPA: bifunctional phosphopantothenoylcysteine decarboxylase/phosphopantothenate--cysteine ligase CoaBC [Candidatus Stackebrandtia excrementipullorum]|nr:bifunctional phosphopantothenoylcysteine decarboxylase/phosphopantothenate--cysteine ligase CoaBC [Candidatus Stackebrandtia excrementipullorum]
MDGHADSRPEIVLGVSGGIAAYKACELLRLFTESGHSVTVVPTRAALNFVGEATWAALSGRPVHTEVFESVHDVPHVRLGRQADLVVVAPATADVLARAATGRADDLLTNTLLTVKGPVLFAPAMHTEMWENPATVENVATLRRRGHVIVEPAVGRLTGADTGKGRLPDPQEIFAAATTLLRRGDVAPDLTDRHVVVTAGGTREPLDPVRFIGNRSSGKQGYALARAALARGARVTLVSANVALSPVAGAELVEVTTTAQLHTATLKAAEHADVVVMAAAPADFRPREYSSSKIKKSKKDDSEMTLELVANADIAADLGRRKKPGRLLVAFAAETHNGLANAMTKRAAKNADLVVLNEVGPDKAFGTDDNAVTLLGDGDPVEVPSAGKDEIADAILDAVVERLT